MADKKTIKPFAEPGFTMFNNCILDHIMPKLRPNAWKVICVAIRQTWGWKDETTESGRREEDEISYSQFMDKTGIGSKSTLSDAIKECMKEGYLKRRQTGRHPGTGKPTYSYSLNRDYELEIASTETVPEASTETVPAKLESSTEIVPVSSDPSTETVHTKETPIKETKTKERKENELFPEKPKDADPTLLELERETLAKREAAGANYAVPAPAGGSFAIGDLLTTIACDRLGRSEPKGKKHDSALAFFEKALKAEGLLQGGITTLTRAVRDWLDPEGEYAFFLPQYDLNPKHELALRHFGIVLSKARKQAGDDGDRRARGIEVTQESLAALDARLAARAPPPEDDEVGKIIKDQLRDHVTRSTFAEYIESSCFVCKDGELVITAPNANKRGWLENRLGQIIRRALAGVDGASEARFEVGSRKKG